MKKQLIFRKLTRRNFQPYHVAEVGVYHPQTSNVRDYIHEGIKCTLVEPDPKSIKLIHDHFGELKNVTLHTCAVFDRVGEIELIQRNASTFVKDLPASPSLVNDNYKINDDDKFTVDCKTFDLIDDGTIDLLSIDIEGSEWYVIKNMKSRPAVLSVETHGASYINPYINEISSWMNENNYVIWYKTGSDTVFVKTDEIETTISDVIFLKIREILLELRRRRKSLEKSLFNRRK